MIAMLSHLSDSLLRPLMEMSATAAFVALIVFLLRLILKKRAPRQVICLMWLLVFARLLLPVALETSFSLVPDMGDLAEQTIQSQPAEEGPEQVLPTDPVQTPVVNTPIQTGPIQPPPVITAPAIRDDAQPAQPPDPEPVEPEIPPVRYILPVLWAAGALAMLVYALASYLVLRRRVFDAIRIERGIWEHPTLRSPFILGMVRPRIYLPMGLDEHTRSFILKHEQAHLSRLDHIVKPVCWFALALHWYNPFAWMAFLLMSRDMEAACDDQVLEKLGMQVKADYSAALLELATNRRFPAPSPLSFGEGDARFRIQNVLSFKKPTLWVTIVAAVVAVAAAVTLLTDRPEEEKAEYYLSEAYPGVEFRMVEEQGISWLEAHYLGGTTKRLPVENGESALESYRSFEIDLIRHLLVLSPDWEPVPDARVFPDESDFPFAAQLQPWRLLEATGGGPEDGPRVYVTPGGNLLIYDWSNDSLVWETPIGSVIEAPGHWAEDAAQCEPGIPNYQSWAYHQTFVREDGQPDRFSFFRSSDGTTWSSKRTADYPAEPHILVTSLPDHDLYIREDPETLDCYLEYGGHRLPLGYNSGAAPIQFYPGDRNGDGITEIVLCFEQAQAVQLHKWCLMAVWLEEGELNAAYHSFTEAADDFERNNSYTLIPDRSLTLNYRDQSVVAELEPGVVTIADGHEMPSAMSIYREVIRYIPRPDLNNWQLTLYPCLDTGTNRQKTFGLEVDWTITFDGKQFHTGEAYLVGSNIVSDQPEHPLSTLAWGKGLVTADTLPDDPEEYYLVAELPEHYLWLYAKNNGAEGLLVWEGNLWQVIDRPIHGGDLTLPVMSMADGCLTIVYSPGDVVRYTNYFGSGKPWAENGIYGDGDGIPILVANGHYGPLPEEVAEGYPNLQLLSGEAAVHVTGYDQTQAMSVMGYNLFEGKPIMERYYVLAWEKGQWTQVLPDGLPDSAWIAVSTPLGMDKLYVIPGEGKVLYTGGKLYPLGFFSGDDSESLTLRPDGTFLVESDLYAGEGPVPMTTILEPVDGGWRAVEQSVP